MSAKLEKIQTVLRACTQDERILFHPILMMHAAHQAGQSYEVFMRDYHKLVEANLHCLDMYGHDAVSVISDPYRETSAFGAKIVFNGDDSPQATTVVKSSADIDNLINPDVYASERTRDRLEAVKLFRSKLGPEFPVIGWVEGPLAEAADLMGMEHAMILMMTEPDAINRLCRKTLQTAKDFAEAQIRAGANIIGIGDAVCSQISPEMYRDFVFENHKELFSYIHQCGALVKLHICGDITHILPWIAQEDVDILDVDWMVDMSDTYRIMGPDVVLCGNLDPVRVIMEGDKDLIRAKFEAIRHSLPVQNWILMGGCEIPMMTPSDNMSYLRELSMHA